MRELNCAWAKPTAIYTTPTSFETLQDYLHKSILVTALETLDLLPASKTRGVDNWTDQLYCADPMRNDFPAPEGKLEALAPSLPLYVGRATEVIYIVICV